MLDIGVSGGGGDDGGESGQDGHRLMILTHMVGLVIAGCDERHTTMGKLIENMLATLAMNLIVDGHHETAEEAMDSIIAILTRQKWVIAPKVDRMAEEYLRQGK